jgi:molecular chaperone HtpG
MADMQKMQGMSMFGAFPESWNVVLNTNHDLARKLVKLDEAEQTPVLQQAFDLAKLSQNLLHGEELTNFIQRNYDKLK